MKLVYAHGSGPCEGNLVGVRVPPSAQIPQYPINYIIQIVYYTYVLRSLKDSTFYTGFTKHLQKRIRQHNAGKSVYSSKHRLFKLVYYESYETKEEAVKREKYFKTTEGRKFYKSKI